MSTKKNACSSEDKINEVIEKLDKSNPLRLYADVFDMIEYKLRYNQYKLDQILQYYKIEGPSASGRQADFHSANGSSILPGPTKL